MLALATVPLYAQYEGSVADTLHFEGFKEPKKLPYKLNVVKASPMPFFIGQIPYCGEIRITYERMLASHHSLLLGGSYNYPNVILLVMSAVSDTAQSFKDFSLRGGRVMFGYRFYPIKRQSAPKGLFFGPYVSYNFVKIKQRKGNGSYDLINYLNADMVVGYQFEMGHSVFMEFMGGIGYRNNWGVYYDARLNRSERYDIYDIKFLKNVKFLLQVNFGYGF